MQVSFDAYCTSKGRVLLAYLRDNTLAAYLAQSEVKRYKDRSAISVDHLCAILRNVRKNGIAIVDHESKVGVRAIAVPIWGLTGRVEVAINVRHTQRISVQEMQNTILALLYIAA